MVGEHEYVPQEEAPWDLSRAVPTNATAEELRYAAATRQKDRGLSPRAGKSEVYTIYEFLTKINFGAPDQRLKIATQLISRWGGGSLEQSRLPLLVRVKVLEDLLNYVSVAGWPEQKKYEVGGLLVAWFPVEGYAVWGDTVRLRELYLKNLGHLELSKRKLTSPGPSRTVGGSWALGKLIPYKNPRQQVL